MNDFYTWFGGLATIGGLAYVLLGFVLGYICYWVRCQIKHEQFIVPWRYAGIAIGMTVLVITSFQAQTAYVTASRVAIEQRACNIEFRKVLIERSRTTKENDDTSDKQRRTLYFWLHDILFPPPPYDKLSTNDPLRQQFVLGRTLQAEDILKSSFEKQDAIQAERDKHQFPDPTCGS